MRKFVVAAGLGLGITFAGCAAGFAQTGALLTRREMRAYHTCLAEAWIEDYCRSNSARPTANYDRVYAECVFANGGGRFPLAGRTWFNTDDYCWGAAHRFR